MDKQDLIYDTVCRIEKYHIKRFELIEKDVADLKCFRDKAIGGIVLLSGICTYAFETIKHFFFK